MQIGKYHELEVSREVDFGVYLLSELGEILLPRKYIPESLKVGDSLKVFVYKDTEDRLIATTETAMGELDDFVSLEVVDKNSNGAFMHWGLIKDLFVPKKEQPQPYQIGERHVVKICLDHKTDRLIGTGKISGLLKKDGSDLRAGQPVDLLIYARSEIGYKAVVDQKYAGLIYFNEVFEELNVGDIRKGFVKRVRDDGKIDLSLKPVGVQAIDQDMAKIIELLEVNNGYLPFNDKSDPSKIVSYFQMSKKAFKKAVGGLLKRKSIKFQDAGIALV